MNLIDDRPRRRTSTATTAGHIYRLNELAAQAREVVLPNLRAHGQSNTRLEWAYHSQQSTQPGLDWLLPRQADLAALSDFVELAQKIPAVKSIRTSHNDRAVSIWIYLDSKPFDRPTRHGVYEAERAALSRNASSELDFHLTNVAEYPPDLQPPPMLGDEVLYERT